MSLINQDITQITGITFVFVCFFIIAIAITINEKQRNKINTMFIFPSFSLSISLFLVMFIFLSSVNRIENKRRNLRGNFAKRRIIKKIQSLSLKERNL